MDFCVASTLAPAERARTAVAAGTQVQVVVDGRPARAPYVDLDGTPVLVVPAEHADALRASSLLCLRMSSPGGLGTVVLSGVLAPLSAGSVRPADREVVDAALRSAVREGVAGVLLQLLVEDVVLTHPGSRGAEPLTLADYAAASPHEVLARGWVLAHHLNAHHRVDVATIAAGVRGVRRPELAAAEVIGIDPDGLDLQLVDLDGGWQYRVPFRVPCRDLAAVGEEFASLVERYAVDDDLV
ncbi:MAG: DUF2470 domain-containing protein [Nocardioides sp.]|nr:DUF2470 domain-containing protein [Nocardioides sp.]